MFRRVLLCAAIGAASLTQSSPASADLCVLTIELRGTVNQTIQQPRCIEWEHGEICQGPTAGPAAQTVKVTVCVPNPLF